MEILQDIIYEFLSKCIPEIQESSLGKVVGVISSTDKNFLIDKLQNVQVFYRFVYEVLDVMVFEEEKKLLLELDSTTNYSKNQTTILNSVNPIKSASLVKDKSEQIISYHAVKYGGKLYSFSDHHKAMNTNPHAPLAVCRNVAHDFIFNYIKQQKHKRVYDKYGSSRTKIFTDYYQLGVHVNRSLITQKDHTRLNAITTHLDRSVYCSCQNHCYHVNNCDAIFCNDSVYYGFDNLTPLITTKRPMYFIAHIFDPKVVASEIVCSIDNVNYNCGYWLRNDNSIAYSPYSDDNVERTYYHPDILTNLWKFNSVNYKNFTITVLKSFNLYNERIVACVMNVNKGAKNTMLNPSVFFTGTVDLHENYETVTAIQKNFKETNLVKPTKPYEYKPLESTSAENLARDNKASPPTLQQVDLERLRQMFLTRENNLHGHKCFSCGNYYAHVHSAFKAKQLTADDLISTHSQFKYQCPYKDCAMFSHLSCGQECVDDKHQQAKGAQGTKPMPATFYLSADDAKLKREWLITNVLSLPKVPDDKNSSSVGSVLPIIEEITVAISDWAAILTNLDNYSHKDVIRVKDPESKDKSVDYVVIKPDYLPEIVSFDNNINSTTFEHITSFASTIISTKTITSLKTSFLTSLNKTSQVIVEKDVLIINLLRNLLYQSPIIYTTEQFNTALRFAIGEVTIMMLSATTFKLHNNTQVLHAFQTGDITLKATTKYERIVDGGVKHILRNTSTYDVINLNENSTKNFTFCDSVYINTHNFMEWCKRLPAFLAKIGIAITGFKIFGKLFS